MASVFSKIISGELPAYKIAENDDFLAFLDISPLVAGHTLVIPKKEVDYIFDMDDEHLAGLMVFAKTVAKKIEKVVSCARIGVSVVGLEVPHTHIHLIPIDSVSDMNFAKPKLNPTKEELSKMAEKIRKA